MGAVSMREDALERLQVLATGAYAPSPVRVKHVEAPPPTYPCPSCEMVFSEAERLSAHLFGRHRNHGFYLRVNDTVPADVVVVPDRPWQLDIIATGGDPIELQVTLPDDRTVRTPLEPGETISLLGYIDQWPAEAATRVTGGAGRSYTIFRGSVPDLNLRELDDVVLASQEPLYAGEPADWRALLDARRPGETLRQRYLDGFAELLLGINSEVHHRDTQTANRSYTRAFGQLRVFGTPLARAATLLLAFRMDAHGLVMRQGPTTTLWVAAHWYSSPPRTLDEVPAPAVAERGIWIDAFMEGLIRVAHQALAGEYGAALEALDTLPRDLADGPGYEAKRDITRARLAAMAGDRELSRRLYARIADNPIYATEAREALS